MQDSMTAKDRTTQAREFPSEAARMETKNVISSIHRRFEQIIDGLDSRDGVPRVDEIFYQIDCHALRHVCELEGYDLGAYTREKLDEARKMHERIKRKRNTRGLASMSTGPENNVIAITSHVGRRKSERQLLEFNSILNGIIRRGEEPPENHVDKIMGRIDAYTLTRVEEIRRELNGEVFLRV